MSEPKKPLDEGQSDTTAKLEQDLNDCRTLVKNQEQLIDIMLLIGYERPEKELLERRAAIPIMSGNTLTEQTYAVGFDSGLEYGANIVMRVHAARDNLDLCEMKIEAAALCEHGKATLAVMKRAIEDLEQALQAHENMLRDISNEPLIRINLDAEYALRTYHLSLIENAKQYLKHKTQSRQTKLQRFIARKSEEVAKIRKEIGVRPSKGRPTDPVNLFIGKYTARCPLPSSGEHWELGKQLYDTLSTKPRRRTPLQSRVLDDLQAFIHIDGSQVLDNTGLGTLVSVHRKRHLARQ